MSRRSEEQDQARSRGRPKAQPKRWSAQRKAEVVLRLPRGEDIGEVSREVRVAPPELERWRRVFLDGGQQGLKGKNRTGGELMRTRAKLGEMTDRRQPGKRGPKTALRDDELLQEIRTVLKASPFLGEGHRKVKARLAARGIRVGKNRVLRLMREHGLLAPVRRGHPCGDRSHSGRIRTERPDELWGTDASRFLDEGRGLLLDLRGRRPLHFGRRWLARCEEGRPLGGAGASPPGRPGPHGRLQQDHRPGPRLAARLGLAVQGKAVPGRDQMARHPLHVPPTWASRNATASRSASSGRSRRSASICTTSRPSRRPGR